MITTSNSPVKRSGIPNQLLGVLLHTLAISGLSRARTELFPLLAVPSLAPHLIQADGQSPRHGDLGDLSSPPHRQVEVLTAPFLAAAHRDLGCFHQHEAQQRVALFRDVSQSSPLPARLLQRHQSQIARDPLATRKPIRSPDNQHEGQRRQCTHPGMRLQSLRLRTFLHFLLDGLRQLGNRGSQLVQQLQQIAPAPARPRR